MGSTKKCQRSPSRSGVRVPQLKSELTRLLEQSVMSLPDQYRTVLMLRDVEELRTSETAAALGLTEDSVKVRLHRGRSLLRCELLERVGTSTRDAFPFMGRREMRVRSFTGGPIYLVL